MRYAVNTNSLNKKMTPEQIAAVAVEAGCTGIEWGLPGPGKVDAFVREAAEATRKQSLRVAGFLNGGSLQHDDFDPSNIERACAAIAGALGDLFDGARVPLRVNPPWFAYNLDEAMHQRNSFRELQARARRNLEAVLPVSEKYAVRFVLETHHGNVCASAPMARELLDGLDPQAVGVLWDPANGIHEGFLRPRIAMEYLGEYLAIVHVKNLVSSLQTFGKNEAGMPVRAEYGDVVTGPEAGQVDWVEAIMALKMAGYDGWLSFEEFFPDDTADRLKRARLFMDECLRAAPDGPIEPFLTLNDTV